MFNSLCAQMGHNRKNFYLGQRESLMGLPTESAGAPAEAVNECATLFQEHHFHLSEWYAAAAWGCVLAGIFSGLSEVSQCCQ